MDEVIAGAGTGELGLGARLDGLAGEVVGSLLVTIEILVSGNIAMLVFISERFLPDNLLGKVNETTVIRGEDGVLEAAGVVELDVELAVLAGVNNGETGAGVGVVGVEEDGERLPVRRHRDGGGALGATGTTVRDGLNPDLSWVGIGSGSLVGRGGEATSNERGEDDRGELHDCKVEIEGSEDC